MTTVIKKTSSRQDYHCKDVYAVIVTFNPDISGLEKLIAALIPQIAGAVIVDNGSNFDISLWHSAIDCSNLFLLKLDGNFGIAYAQNVGIKALLKRDPKYILLSDQDSIPDLNMVCELRNTAIHLTHSGKSVAAIGPYYYDTRKRQASPFFRVEGFSFKRQLAKDAANIVEVDFLIASGCLIPVDVFDTVGLMNADLFIDYVDTEWGLRAKIFGFQSFGIFSTSMKHTIGDKYVNFLGREITFHSPIRYYYYIRNGIWLYKQKHLPLNWKIADGSRMLVRFFINVLISESKWENFYMMVRGLMDGINSKMGHY